MRTEINTLLTFDEVISSVNGTCVIEGQSLFCFTSVATDSRLVEKNTLFIPLIGEFQDGHKYIPQALEKGSSVVFITMQDYKNNKNHYEDLKTKYKHVYFIAVDNTLKALQDAAMRYVEKFPRLIKIGITGSSGKTTTKEIAASILSQQYKVITNKGNLNSETGLPLSVFNIRSEHQIGLFEMGMNRVNEIGEIASVLKPHYAIITNIGTAHIGILGSRENIATEKAKIFNYLGTDGVAFIPNDDDFCSTLASHVKGRVVYYGDNVENSSVKFIEDKGLEGTLLSISGVKATLALPGKYNYQNALAAIAISEVLGVSSLDIANGISSLKPFFGRSEVIHGKYTIIRDCYNANPDSMEKAIELCSSVTTTRKKIFILGDMLELGDESANAHTTVGITVAHSKANVVFFVGKEMQYAYDAAVNEKTNIQLIRINGKDDEDINNIVSIIKQIASNEDIILLKGSRGMQLERISELLQNKEVTE